MNKVIKIILIIFIFCFIIFFVPFLINVVFKIDFNISLLQSEWTAGDALNFYGSVLSFIGTITLGTISVWQTKKANNLSEKVLENSLIESTTIPQLQNKFDIDFKENKDTTITMSTHHKMDYGAIIAIEPFDKETKKLNQYLMDLHFKCSGKGSNIKEILIDNILCVQDPSDGGLKWEDNSDDPIPLGLDIDINNKTYLNWVSEDEFFIQIKVYCEPGKCFDSMMKNDADLCFMFNLTILNFNGIKTKMHYKMWLQNFQGISVIKTNSTFLENECN